MGGGGGGTVVVDVTGMDYFVCMRLLFVAITYSVVTSLILV